MDLFLSIAQKSCWYKPVKTLFPIRTYSQADATNSLAKLRTHPVLVLVTKLWVKTGSAADRGHPADSFQRLRRTRLNAELTFATVFRGGINGLIGTKRGIG